ncbi:ribonuclease-like [Pseudonaja textilis]|uniref:ribonuclease-like n=1 Tax=Pseudonaja textilis TaxID=8673 RepID=UPI000EA9980E|nr:ribonuclease-like [Pseudonaja textilis]
MLFKGFGLGFFVVLAVVLILGIFATNYPTFLRQHYNNPKSNVRKSYCNAMMQSREMTNPNCKPLNSFIHDTKNRITAVCGSEGTPFGNRLQRSLRPFRVTTCKMRGSSILPPCEYRENTSPRYIVIACENGLPVHYEEGQI